MKIGIGRIGPWMHKRASFSWTRVMVVCWLTLRKIKELRFKIMQIRTKNVQLLNLWEILNKIYWKFNRLYFASIPSFVIPGCDPKYSRRDTDFLSQFFQFRGIHIPNSMNCFRISFQFTFELMVSLVFKNTLLTKIITARVSKLFSSYDFLIN